MKKFPNIIGDKVDNNLRCPHCYNDGVVILDVDVDTQPVGVPCPMCMVGEMANARSGYWNQHNQPSLKTWENGLTAKHLRYCGASFILEDRSNSARCRALVAGLQHCSMCERRRGEGERMDPNSTTADFISVADRLRSQRDYQQIQQAKAAAR